MIRPTEGDSVKERQQKVVQMAQEAIKALNERADNLMGQMTVVRKIRKVLYFMNEDNEVQKIRGMLMDDLIERKLVPVYK